jgi:RHS repeat-associated protein
MQLASSARIPDGFMAAMRLGGEKPHQGLPGRNPALYQGPTVSNSTTALGLRGQAELNRVGSCTTGKERDSESGNDYFGARYYSSITGRFMSPDWSAKVSPVPYATMDDPQSLNLYAYAHDNPISAMDPDGHMSNADFSQMFMMGLAAQSGAWMQQQTAQAAQAQASAIEWNYLTSILMSAFGMQQPEAQQTTTLTPAVDTASTNPPWNSRGDVLNIVGGDNTCSAWLNQGTGNAQQIMSNVPINISNHCCPK